MKRRTWGLFAMAAWAACTPAPAPPPPLAPAPGPIPVERPRAYAAPITDAAQLIGGPTAKGRVGDLKIWNDRIQVIIGAADHGEGYLLSGGGILDADRMRAPGELGRSSYGEVILAVDFRVLDPRTVTVERDGSDGGPAVLTALGEEIDFPLLAAVIEGYEGRRPEHLRMRVRYLLHPEAEYLRIEYQLSNDGGQPVGLSVGVLGFVFGDGAQPFVPGAGFEPPTEGTAAPYYAAVDRDVSYLYAPEAGRLNFAASYSGLLAASFLGSSAVIEPGEATGFTHLLYVGDGNLSRAQSLFLAKDKIGTRRVYGTVLDGLGDPVEGARIHLIADDQDRAGEYTTRVETDRGGRYVVDLPLGRYRVQITAPGHVAMAPLPLDVVDSSAPTARDFRLEAPGTIEIAAHAEDGSSLPTKLTAVALDRSFNVAPATFGEPDTQAGATRVEYFATGRGSLTLPAGRHRIFLSHGAEYEVATTELDLLPGGRVTFTATLAHSVHTPGWLSSDTHLHSQRSADSWDLYEDIVRVMAAEGLEVPVSTEHELLGDFNPAITALGLSRWMKGIIGTEVSTGTFGHFNAYPLVPNPALHGNGWINWYGKDVIETFALIRSNPADPVLQVNHPRDGSRLGYFDAMGFDAATHTVVATDRWSDEFDVLEIMNQCDIAHVEQKRLPDWFSFLERGQKKFAVGGSDSHHARRGELGYPRTWMRLGTDDPGAVTAEHFRDTVKAGRMIVSCGPFVDFRIGAAQIGDTITSSAAEQTLEARVEAPSWMDVDQLEVIADGRLVKLVQLPPSNGDAVRFSGPLSFTRPHAGPGWVLLRVRGDRRHDVYAQSALPWAITNPIFLGGP